MTTKLALTLALTGAVLVAPSALAQPPGKAPPSKTAPSAKKGATAKKSIVLVHGAFADGSSWDKVTALLQTQGYQVVAVHLPMTTLADDVAATRRAIEMQPGKVVLVGHSYGGLVISEAGAHDKVTGLVYVAAFGPEANESITDLGKGKPPMAWSKTIKVDSGGYAWLPPETMTKDFAQGLPAADIAVLTAKQAPILAKTFDTKVKTAAWKTKPSWYVRTADDRMIDPEAQATMAKRMNATTTSIPANHVPMISKPNEVMAVIIEAATAPAVARK